MLIEHIKEYYNKKPRDQGGNGLRASSAGSCQRQLAYKYHGYSEIPLNWRAKLVFKLGDHVETDLVESASECGLTNKQSECSVEIEGMKIKGHCDGIFQDHVVDFKSCTTFAFKAAKKGIVGSYLYTMHFYMKAFGLKKALLIYYVKETSNLCEVVLDWDEKVWLEVESKFRAVIKSNKTDLLPRDYGPSEKTGNLPWQCSYCSFVNHCWPDVQLSFGDDGKPVLTVKKAA